MEVKELIIDYSKWRSGQTGKFKTGVGDTALLNKEGSMCCIGQFCEQLGIPSPMLLNNGEPNEIEDVEDGLFVYIDIDYGCAENTQLTRGLIRINDDPDTTPEQKIDSIRMLLSEQCIELKVINKPS